MNRAYRAIVIVAATAIVLAGCDPLGLLPLDAEARVAAFLSELNADDIDYGALRDNFSPDANDYGSMNTAAYWSATTVFNPATEAPFAVSGLTAGGSISYGSAEIYTGTLTSTTYPGGVEVQFAFVEDDDLQNNMLIRAIVPDFGVTASDPLDNVIIR